MFRPNHSGQKGKYGTPKSPKPACDAWAKKNKHYWNHLSQSVGHVEPGSKKQNQSCAVYSLRISENQYPHSERSQISYLSVHSKFVGEIADGTGWCPSFPGQSAKSSDEYRNRSRLRPRPGAVGENHWVNWLRFMRLCRG